MKKYWQTLTLEKEKERAKTMARVTAIVNQKGGVGKTSTAAALAAALYDAGHEVLTIDADAQGSLTFIRGVEAGPGLYEAMTGEGLIEDIIVPTSKGDFLAGGPALTGADMEFTKTGREYIIRDLLKPLQDIYSHIIIDCPPQLGILAINALTAADDAIIPMAADILSLQGLGQLQETIEAVKKYCNPSLKVAGLLICRYSNRATLNRNIADVIEQQAQAAGFPTYKTKIREGVAVREAQTMRESIFDTHPKANATADYKAFVKEYLKQEEKTK